jgi:hypothetical protein
MLGGYLKLCLIMAKVGSLDANLGGYLNYFPNRRCCYLYINVGGYFELFFVMTEVGNLHANIGGYFMYFS